jgi:Amt family ammonium transporter
MTLRSGSSLWDRFSSMCPSVLCALAAKYPSDVEIEFMRIKRKWGRSRPLMFVAAVFGAMSLLAIVEALFAQEPAKKTADAAPAAAAAPATPAAATLPPYFAPDPSAKDSPWPDPTGGAAGYWTTPSAAPGDDDPAKLTIPGLYDRIAHNMISINHVWVLVAGFLVMFMQAGFAAVEAGLCRVKNSAHTMTMNMMIYPLGCIAFYAYGFALGWGNWWNGPVAPGWYPSLGPGLSLLNGGWGIGADPSVVGAFKYGIMGTKGWCLTGMEDVSVLTMFFFMMVFMDTTATIPTGSMAERWAWKNFCIYGLWVALPYCLYANWVWGGGWLAQMGKNWHLGHGAVDFAGSGVVHAMGGAIALAGAIIIGPRIGKYGSDGKPRAFPGHNIPMAIIGTFILAFGWFGFNPGSTLSGTDLRMSLVVVNTMLASVTGALATMCYLMFTGKKPDPSMLLNGMLAGLVAITAPCAFVETWAACAIGAIAGVLVVWSVTFWDNAGVDDPVGAISVHGVNGLWGVISLGIFASGKYGAGWNGIDRFGALSDAGKEAWKKSVGVAYDGVRGILYGDTSQLWAQLIDAATVAIFGFLMAWVWFKVSNLITPIRVSADIETKGLDYPEMGAIGYAGFVTEAD